MKTCCFRGLLLAVALLAARDALAQIDTVSRIGSAGVTGKITNVSPEAVSVDGKPDVEVNQIALIRFGGEPTQLATARSDVTNGRFENARTLLTGINPAEVQRDLIKQDIEFYQAYCDARLSLAGAGSVADAGKKMIGFYKQYPTSYHHYRAAEVLGDLLVALGNYSSAETYYAELAKAKWPEYRMKAGVLLGRALQSQNKHNEARAKFDEVLQLPAASTDGKRHHLAATLGKAVSLASSSQVDPAIKMILTVIQEADPEAAELHARAYNALGTCYEKAGKSKPALLAFLHVHLLYNMFPEAHAEALAHLGPLWERDNQGDRAREADTLLKQHYPGSRWAQRQ